MAQTIDKPMPQRKDFPSEEQFEAHRYSYGLIYELQNQVSRLHEQLKMQKRPTSDIGPAPAPIGDAKAVVTSHLNGVYVKAGQPADGQTIRYRAASGQFEFGT